MKQNHIMSLEQQTQKKNERFQTLFNCFSDAQWSEAVILNAQSRLGFCESQARLSQDRMNALIAAADTEHKHLVKIKRHGVRYARYKI